MGIFQLLAVPLGAILRLVYQLFGNYFVAIFFFTLLVKLVTFPFSLKSQKATADRARLAPRLERLQKKYGQDRQKLQQKTQELYEKEGVSLTGGCLPMLIPMIILFGVIGAIYQPLTHLTDIPTEVISASVDACTVQKGDKDTTYKLSATDAAEGSYYRELRLMEVLEHNKDAVIAKIDALGPKTLGDRTGTEYYAEIIEMRGEFQLFGLDFLGNPWKGGFSGINWLWIIPLLSGVTALLSSFLSQHYNKATMSPEQQQMKGCTGVMLYFMPLFSAYISFIVPGAVGIYWIFSNVFALGQTYVLNRMYNPAKIREQAEIEYKERRARRAAERAEEKRRLAEARQREEELEAKYAQMEAEGKTFEPKEEKSNSLLSIEMPQGVKKDKKSKKDKTKEDTTPENGDTEK